MSAQPRRIGRYLLFDELASGGMATVHLGRLVGPVGFARTVAIKRLHPQFAKDPEFVAMFLDEARIAARIRHPNVVPTLDVVAKQGELFLVMDYVEGEALSRLQRTSVARGLAMPPRIVVGIIAGVLEGLHAAHEAVSESGHPMGIVHRDVSPQNILVGTDGVPRLLDFGVAKAINRSHATREGAVKGKCAYMSPEQLRGGAVDGRADLWATGVVLWEMLTGKRLFAGESPIEIAMKVLETDPPRPSASSPGVPAALDDVVMRALRKDGRERFRTAEEMVAALHAAVPGPPAREIGTWVDAVAHDILSQRSLRVREVESASSNLELDEVPESVFPFLERLTVPPRADDTEPGGALEGAPSAAATDPRMPELPPASAARADTEPARPAFLGASPVSDGSGTSTAVITDLAAPLALPIPAPASSARATGPHQATSRSSNGKPAVVVGVVVAMTLGVLALGALGLTGRRWLRAEVVAPASAAASGIARPLGEDTALADERVPTPDGGSWSVAATLASAESARSSGAPSAAPEASAVKGRPKARSVPVGSSARPPRADCTSPFTIDANGDRHPKPECM
jgi:serine/threonine-protein kinase